MHLSSNLSRLSKGLLNAASSIVLSTVALSAITVEEVQADELTYDGTDQSVLTADPTDINASRMSLLPRTSDETNNITVKGAVAGQRTLWENTIAPYNVYGFASVQYDVTGNNGIDGASNTGAIVSVKDVEYDWSGAGNKATNAEQAGRLGGMGGGSVFGGLSAGAPGSTAYDGTNVALGGNGGYIKGVHVTLDNVAIHGADAGEGNSSPDNNHRGSTVGGMGGGSVFGAISIGGAGAWSTRSTADGSNGGNGGDISGNYVTLKKTDLYGGKGGNGGSKSGGSAAGFGGASVLGGVSIGGAGGTSYNGTQHNSQGGSTGVISDNHVILTDVTLTGADGGNGGSALSVNGSGGTAGFGGGIIGGGLAIAGGGGFAGGSGASNSDGGHSGAIHDNELILTHVTITGGNAGKGGDGAPNSGGGVGGMGGGLIFGGMTIGGAGGSGYAAETSSGNGGIADYVKSNSVTLVNVTIDGGAGGAGGSSTTSGGGAGGAGGATVFGGLSMGGAGGAGDAALNTENSESAGGNGGASGVVSNNIISLDHTTLNGGIGGNGGQGGGIGGIGGGSVIGGLSTGGGGGNGSNSKKYNGNGGDSGDVINNRIKIVDSTLNGNAGGTGGSISHTITILDEEGEKSVSMGGSGAGGTGGGSVFGGISLGGAGGYGSQGGLINGVGGNAGTVSGNIIILERVELHGGAGGAAGKIEGENNSNEGSGIRGSDGGSIYGGASVGGAGGIGYDATQTNGNGGKGGNVTNNRISLTDVTLYGTKTTPNGDHKSGVYGGISIGGDGGFGDISKSVDKNGGKGGDAGDVSSNRIEISGKSAINKDIYGGLSQGGKAGTHFDDKNKLVNSEVGFGGDANHNSVTLNGDQIVIGERDERGNVIKYGSIWGGRSLNGDGQDSLTADVFSGNTLNLNGYRGTVAGIHNFENYNWTLPTDVKNGDTVIKIAEGGTPVDLTNTKHTIAGLDPNGPRFMAGDMVTMIDKSAGSWSPASYTLKQGQFIFYDTTLKQNKAGDNTAFILQINKKTDKTPGHDHGDDHDHTGDNTGDNNGNNSGDHNNPGQSAAQLNPQSKTYSEGRAASLAFVSQGSDIIANSMGTISSLATRTDHRFNHPLYVPFIITGGSSSRYQTGSHVEIDGFNMIAGLAFGFNLEAGHKVTTGAFFEYGRGTYDTYNSFDRFASVHGDGDSDYKGGGILARIEFAGTGLGLVKDLKPDETDGLYADASLRFGQSDGKFTAGRKFGLEEQVVDYHGSYDSTVNYFGGHVTGGYVFNFDDQRALDVYGRYLWTHMESDTVKIEPEQLHFDSATSSRIELGARYSYQYNDWFKPYVGATYDYEFDGDVGAKAYEFNLHKPSLEGSTGIFEAGFRMNPLRDNKALTINVDGQGYVGARQGGGGGVKLKYEF
ncbi:autotransporter outer membrane beta-barrel domain-containing protein [Bartonella sp. W8122]|uniref:autotransporter outer membrane beta-barrel domain-containing protein n=1 Tax=Bartonella sp. W8122 TaxID=2750930 RepID=UPI0018DC9407|nr:autotransporter outer membrane beta-barrel domain-containing protein [Bartonella sp. W8122]MBI0002172.1 autotransporter outer membrane beta-barrel domain-containing protein [Bartonella sp. W8122]